MRWPEARIYKIKTYRHRYKSDPFRSHLDGNSLYCGNHIQGTAKHTITVERGVEFPNGLRVLNGCNLSDDAHNSEDSQVVNVLKATTAKMISD